MQKHSFPSNEGAVSHLIPKLSSPQWLIILKKWSLKRSSAVWTEPSRVGPSSSPSVRPDTSPWPGGCSVHTSPVSISQLPGPDLWVRPSRSHPPPSPLPHTAPRSFPVCRSPCVRLSVRPRRPGALTQPPRVRLPCCAPAPRRVLYRRGRTPRARPARPGSCSSAGAARSPRPDAQVEFLFPGCPRQSRGLAAHGRAAPAPQHLWASELAPGFSERALIPHLPSAAATPIFSFSSAGPVLPLLGSFLC